MLARSGCSVPPNCSGTFMFTAQEFKCQHKAPNRGKWKWKEGEKGEGVNFAVNASQNISLQKAMNLCTCRDMGTLTCTVFLTFPVNNNNIIKTAVFKSSQQICYNWCDLDRLSRSRFSDPSMKQACTSNFRYNCHYDVYIYYIFPVVPFIFGFSPILLLYSQRPAAAIKQPTVTPVTLLASLLAFKPFTPMKSYYVICLAERI